MKILVMMTLDVFRLSLGWALESLGHQVIHLSQAREDRLEDAIRVHKPDIFFDMGWDVEHCNPDNLTVIKRVLDKYGTYHVYFAEEDSLHFELWSKGYAELMRPDFVLTRAPHCIPLYEAMGIKSAYLDVGSNWGFHRRVQPRDELKCDVSLVCNGQFIWDIYRRKSIGDLVVPLFNSPHHVQIWGRDWDSAFDFFGASPSAGVHKGLLEFYMTPYAFSSAKINLSIQSVGDQISNRTYDILSCGGFLLTSNSIAVRSYLEPGVCCVVSDSQAETLDLVDYYLAHDEERQQIANNGMALAHSKLAYQITLPPVLEKIERDVRSKRRSLT